MEGMNDMYFRLIQMMNEPKTSCACVGFCYLIGKQERKRGDVGSEPLSTLGGVVTRGECL